MHTLPPTLRDRSLLLDRLGSDEVAATYRAKDLVLEQSVAVKVVAEATHVQRLRFRLDIAALARLAHPAIVRLLGGGSCTGTAAYLAPEQVQGARVGPATDVYALCCRR